MNLNETARIPWAAPRKIAFEDASTRGKYAEDDTADTIFNPPKKHSPTTLQVFTKRHQKR